MSNALMLCFGTKGLRQGSSRSKAFRSEGGGRARSSVTAAQLPSCCRRFSTVCEPISKTDSRPRALCSAVQCCGVAWRGVAWRGVSGACVARVCRGVSGACAERGVTGDGRTWAWLLDGGKERGGEGQPVAREDNAT